LLNLLLKPFNHWKSKAPDEKEIINCGKVSSKGISIVKLKANKLFKNK